MNWRQTITKILLFVGLPLLVVASCPRHVAADAAADAAATELYGTTMSPYCPGVTLSACTSEDARALREQILGQLNQGVTVEEVRSQLIGRYGREVLGLPQESGFGVVAWIIPPLVALGGAIGLLIFIKKSVPRLPSNVSAPDSDTPVVSGVSTEMRERIEREVRERLG